MVVALSGGVDSSVAAAVLAADGWQVIGVTLRLHDCQEGGASRSCCGVDSIARARAVAAHLGIPHYVVDGVEAFAAHVLRPAWDEYAAGRTPSPCLLCNERIKFGMLLEWARGVGAESLATGHYARLAADAGGTPQLLRGLDPGKDQAYFLAGLTLEQLRAVLFPLGTRHKHEIRELARTLALPSAETPDSQDACLVAPGQSFAEMLRQRFAADPMPGMVVDPAGRVVGPHAGLHLFTVGQRKGLPGNSTSPRWVKAICADTATVVVTGNVHDLDGQGFVATGMNWLDEAAFAQPCRCQVQVRYRHEAAAATAVRIGPDSVRVACDAPIRAITPGQAAVFYDGARVLGRGWIRVDD